MNNALNWFFPTCGTPMILDISTLEITIIVFAFVLGGFCKGVSGIGVPLIAVPVKGTVTDITLAIILVAIPSVVPNFYQVWRFRNSWTGDFSLFYLSIFAIAGSGVGILILTSADPELLSQYLGVILIGYYIIRHSQPFYLNDRATRLLAGPMGFLSGLAGGMTGVSAPVILIFMTAVKLRREAFIFGISVYFIAMGSGQFVWLMNAGLMTIHLAVWSSLTLLPIALGMSLGQQIGKHMSHKQFEYLIQLLALALGVKLLTNL